MVSCKFDEVFQRELEKLDREEWKRFKDGSVIFRCKTPEAAEDLFRVMKEEDIHWVTGRELKDTRWEENKADTVYVYEPWSYGIAYGNYNGRHNPWVKDIIDWVVM